MTQGQSPTHDLDTTVGTAVAKTAAQLATLAGSIGTDRVKEQEHVRPAFLAALEPYFGRHVRLTEKTLPLDDWDPTPGGVDVIVDGPGTGYQLFAELKWCQSKRELGWTLWDVYKMAASQEQYRPGGCYAVVGAPDAYWGDSSIDCSDLFADGRWNSLELFRRNWWAWLDLLHGGSARPLRVPTEVATTLVTHVKLQTTPPWSVRLLKVSAGSKDELPFRRSWPVGVVRCDELANDAVLPSQTERIRGCVLGGAVGDALGAPVEFVSLQEIRAAYGPDGITEYASAYGKAGAITDDTQMTLFTAEGLMRAHNRAISKGICSTPDVVWYAYQRWRHTQGLPPTGPLAEPGGLDGWLVAIPALHSRRAPGNTCLSALGSDRPGTLRHPLNDSKGSGAVMRAAPAGVLPYTDPFESGCELAAVTHGHPSGYLAAGFLAAVIARLIDGQPLWDAATEVYWKLPETSAGKLARPSGRAEIMKALKSALTLAVDGTGPSPAKVAMLGQGWVAEEAIAIALYCSLTAYSFADGIRLAVNHDGDSDTTGAIAGNLLGALYGGTGIPDAWLDRLELRETIETIAADLTRHARNENFTATEGSWPELVDGEWERYPGW